MWIETKGNIVNMSSTAGLVGQVYNVPYCATKAGVVMLSKSMAIEFADRGVRVNAICPGWTRTARVDQLLQARSAKSGSTEQEEAAKIAADIPLGRMGDPEEFARAAVFLASPVASYITGVSLLVDGGQYKGAM